MNLSKAITQGWEECVGEKVYGGYEDIEKKVNEIRKILHQQHYTKEALDTASFIVGEYDKRRMDYIYTKKLEHHRNHVKEHYPKALERVIESLWDELTPYCFNNGELTYEGEKIGEILNQVKETLQELNQK